MSTHGPNTMQTRQAESQASEYGFPYHHLPSHNRYGVRVGRTFRGGAEYMAYLDIVRRLVVESSPRSVLDVGCGDGRLLAELASTTDRGPSLVGVDLDEHAIELARALVPTAQFECTDVSELDGEYDAVTCIETLEHLPDDLESEFLGDVCRSVAPGGTLVITVPSDVRPVSAKHFRHYSTASLLESLAATGTNLRVVTCREIIPSRPMLERSLKLLSNRVYSLDAAPINQLIYRLHRAPVATGARGLHVLMVAHRVER